MPREIDRNGWSGETMMVAAELAGPTHAAFLRGMNVGGHRITNGDLRDALTALKLREVACFRASGNVVFTGGGEDADALAARIEEQLGRSLGYAVPTFVRTASEVASIASARPFGGTSRGAAGGKLQVALLSAAPSRRAREEALAYASDEDRLALSGRELYWLPRGGVLDSPLDLKALGKLLGVMTMRTKGTIEQLVARHFAG